jgi:hypothetical protein
MRRFSCHAPSRSRSARRFFQRWQQHDTPVDIVRRFRISLRCAQRLLDRFARDGEAGLMPHYARCGQQQPQATPATVVARCCQLRRDYPHWGAEMIRLELQAQGENPPTAHTIRRYLRDAGLQPAPVGRRVRPRLPVVPRAERPHQGWQMDASEEIVLQTGQRVCWLRVVDECSGAFLQTIVFASARWERVDRHTIQHACRQIFTRWGLPERLRVDNGYPWGSTNEFPPELALWFIGLGLELLWIRPACPQQNGVVERAQGIGKNWAEPTTCRSVAELQRRCDKLDQRQRDCYPYRAGQSRCQVYPDLGRGGVRYRPQTEAQHWEVGKVWQAVAQIVGRRRVDQTGQISLYNQSRYVGKQYRGQEVYVSLDPSGPTWIVANAAGQELRTHAAQELSTERICQLTVTGRKSRDQP